MKAKMKKLLTVCLLIVTSFTINAQEDKKEYHPNGKIEYVRKYLGEN